MKNNVEEFLNTLNDKSVWVFTKQETDFDTAVLATKLFNEIPDIEKQMLNNILQNTIAIMI